VGCWSSRTALLHFEPLPPLTNLEVERVKTQKRKRRPPVYIHVPCWRGCGRVIAVESERYSQHLVCGVCWDEE
jgi:hypothetical protein